MSRRISNKTKNRYKEAIQDVVKGLSRKIIVYKPSAKSECPNCYFDSSTGRSTGKCKWTPIQAINKQKEWIAAGNNPSVVMYKYFLKGRCPVCSGIGYLQTKRKRYVECLVHWRFNETNARGYTPAGKTDPIWVKLKTDPKYFDLFKDAERVVIDGIECEIANYPSIRGMGNSSTLIVTAFTVGYTAEATLNKIYKYK